MLRVYFDSLPDRSRAFAWAVYDARGYVIRQGRDTPSRWPTEQRREAVLGASLESCLTLDLPPMNAARRDAAIRLALDDKLIAPSAQMHIVAEPLSDNRVAVRAVETSLLDALRSLNFTRVISEADLLPDVAQCWHCCIAENNKGFVRRDDRSAFAADFSTSTPPVELLLALKQATNKPNTLRLHAANAETLRASWQKALPAPLALIAEKPWQWQQASTEQFARAPNLLPVVKTTSERPATRSRWRLALLLTASALTLHVALTGVAWGVAAWQHWQIKRGWQTLTQEAGLPENSTARDWARAYAQLRHQAGLAAPDDALPLLARAAPTLTLLPKNALRRAVYADAAWTIEWHAVDAAHRTDTEAALRQARLIVMAGGDAETYRLRIQAQELTP
jgi:General secretion pathway protein L (GspL).